MKTQNQFTAKWYAKTINTGSAHEQGLVIEETTGRNIAVAYNAKDAPLLASAPDLLALAEHIDAMATDAYLSGHPEWAELTHQARAAIAKAKGD